MAEQKNHGGPLHPLITNPIKEIPMLRPSLLALICLLALSLSATLSAADAAASYNHDMSAYKTLAEAALQAVKDGKMPTAVTKTKELEKAFDDGTADFKKADPALWKPIDKEMDVAMEACAGTDAAKATAELTKFIAMLAKVPKK